MIIISTTLEKYNKKLRQNKIKTKIRKYSFETIYINNYIDRCIF